MADVKEYMSRHRDRATFPIEVRRGCYRSERGGELIQFGVLRKAS